MNLPDDYCDRISQAGFACVEDCLDAAEVAALQAAVDRALREHQGDESVRDRGGVFAIRNVTEVVPSVRELARQPNVVRLVKSILGPEALLVRGLLFDKSTATNWGIFWHQDLSIAVQRREAVPDYGPWSVKAGVPHVQPPAFVLRGMLTVRLHLDDCPAENGALRVLPGSHAGRRLSPSEAGRLEQTQPPETCAVRAGGAILMRPLLLHSSNRSTRDARRRVIHLEFASAPLPAPLRWFIAEPVGNE